ncbi:MAG: hypothetical protein XD78_2065 [Desulfotomaculum sp. 46_296]|nr:MAG: hypothetical protein XD78_2065 [Desulfotomaculum sp. 46_296]
MVIVKGKWLQGKTIFDIVDDLKEGDVILKGANSVDLTQKRAAILIGHPRGGTTTAALQAVAGRRVACCCLSGWRSASQAILMNCLQSSMLPAPMGRVFFRFREKFSPKLMQSQFFPAQPPNLSREAVSVERKARYGSPSPARQRMRIWRKSLSLL